VYRSLLLVTLLLVALLPARADAVEIFINGVRATGLKSQLLQNCTVSFDASGNVYITAKGYAVKKVEATGSNRARQSYFLVSTFNRQGYAQYDVDVFFNGKWVRKIRGSEGQVIADVTGKLPSGKVTVHFAATKNLAGKERLSTSAGDYLRILIGSGSAGGGTVNITDTLADFRAGADKTANFSHEASITIP
jgi:hypothetical protein